MKKGLFEIVTVLDRSGSMGSMVEEAISGYNSFIKEQKEVEGEAKVTLVRFDDVYEVMESGVDINECIELNSNNFVPRNYTALYDAIGKTINDVGERLASTPEDERPEKVLFCVITDGHENASKDFSLDKVKEMVEHQTKKYNWEFFFIGANIDSFGVGASLGFNTNNIANYVSDGFGQSAAFASVSTKLCATRTGDVRGINKSMADTYTDIDKETREKSE